MDSPTSDKNLEEKISNLDPTLKSIEEFLSIPPPGFKENKLNFRKNVLNNRENYLSLQINNGNQIHSSNYLNEIDEIDKNENINILNEYFDFFPKNNTQLINGKYIKIFFLNN